MDLSVYLARIENLTKNYENHVYELLERSSNYVLAIPKQRMYLRGTDANDEKITPSYDEWTIRDKKAKGQVTSHVTLRNTGAWKRSWKLVKEGTKITFTAPNDLKTGFLVSHYSSNELFGFSPKDGEQIYKNWIKPDIEGIIYPSETIDIKI